MESKKINQLATELAPELSDLTIIGDPTTGISKKITLSQMASLFTGTVEEYANLASFPLVGTADTIYIALDTNIIYRWNTGTSAYVELSPNIVTSLVFSDANGFDGTISLVGSTATLTITTALTQGSVPFIGTSGALSQDNANLFFDDTNNRLGINTNTPTTALDVFGSGIIGRLNGTSTNNAFLGFASAGSNKWSIGNVQSDHRFRIYNEATTSELVSVLQTGEFGIGIANPLTKLHIFGGASALIANLDANTSVAKSISFRSGNSSRINLEVSGTESGSNAGMNFFLRTYTDAGSLLETPFQITRSTGITTIKELALTNVLSVANGGTGITSLTTGRIPFGNGTSAFGSSANLNWDNTNSRLGIGISTPISRIHLVEVGGPSVVPTMTISQDGDLGLDWVAGALNFYSYDGSTNSRGGIGHIRVAAETAYNTGATPSYMAFYTHPNIANNNTTLGAATEKMRISANGNVGIGTINPTGRLMLYQSTAGNLFQNIVSPNGGSTQVGINLSPSMTDGEIASNPAQASIYATDSNFGANIIFATKATGAVGNSLVERVRITSGGNLQITASDSALYTKAAASGKAIYWDIRNSADSRRGYIGFGGDGSSDFQFSNNENGSQAFITNGSERWRITSSGNFVAASSSYIQLTGNNAMYMAVGSTITGALGGSDMLINNTSGTGGIVIANRTSIVGVALGNGATSWSAYSDERMKTNIEDISNSLEKLMTLRTVKYHLKDIDEETDQKRYGVIAQDLVGKFDELLDIDKNDFYQVRYTELIPILINAIKELKTELDILKAK